MTATADQLLRAILQLAPEDWAELVSRLMESFDSQADPDAEALWDEEIRARVEDVKAGRVKTVPWSDARAQILADDDGGS